MKILKTPSQEVPYGKDWFNLGYWALKNNFYVHPAFLNAVKTKEKILIITSILTGFLVALFLLGLLI